MSVLVTQQAPDFKAQAVMPDGQFKEVSLSDYRGKYVVLFFYPLDFTFVCPTEIIAFSDRAAEFEALNVQILGSSIDSHFSHLAWTQTPRAVIGSNRYRHGASTASPPPKATSVHWLTAWKPDHVGRPRQA